MKKLIILFISILAIASCRREYFIEPVNNNNDNSLSTSDSTKIVINEGDSHVTNTFDTTIVMVNDTTLVVIYDSVTVNVYDTTYIDINNEIRNEIYDTTYVTIYDTTIINNDVHVDVDITVPGNGSNGDHIFDENNEVYKSFYYVVESHEQSNGDVVQTLDEYTFYMDGKYTHMTYDERSTKGLTHVRYRGYKNLFMGTFNEVYPDVFTLNKAIGLTFEFDDQQYVSEDASQDCFEATVKNHLGGYTSFHYYGNARNVYEKSTKKYEHTPLHCLK
ncbi:hypothetical protein KMW28_27080 [Flammeovirga yaeyamensis]|uniref:Lipoprotein n=1 Tax=Flammeovirga yaeyamensis TaxID=367791 RepID=A0AAX1NAR3_9BACT|nr:hypothetical protein [Flammeovirga yaeyamensis]MBB3700057.1 hypothetical protein [Flammeovirga yaeyamensis]NMF37507.1 hypothetical protein [Flammeovirga yaeyamensis]QWG04564.1 hypothetical protein KMW28_27080 [Flammeovirga yaeyamensis]